MYFSESTEDQSMLDEIEYLTTKTKTGEEFLFSLFTSKDPKEYIKMPLDVLAQFCDSVIGEALESDDNKEIEVYLKECEEENNFNQWNIVSFGSLAAVAMYHSQDVYRQRSLDVFRKIISFYYQD